MRDGSRLTENSRRNRALVKSSLPNDYFGRGETDPQSAQLKLALKPDWRYQQIFPLRERHYFWSR